VKALLYRPVYYFGGTKGVGQLIETTGQTGGQGEKVTFLSYRYFIGGNTSDFSGAQPVAGSLECSVMTSGVPPVREFNAMVRVPTPDSGHERYLACFQAVLTRIFHGDAG